MSANWLYKSSKGIDILPELIDLEQMWYQTESNSAELIDGIVAVSSEILNADLNKQDNLYNVIDFLLDEMAFSGPGLQELPESLLSCVNYCITHRTGGHIAMSIVFCHVLQKLNFECLVSEINEELTLMVKLSNSEVILIDPLTGATEYLIASDDVKQSIVSDVASLVNPIEYDELIKIVLTEQKINLLEENQFELALACVETLMELLPEDPYERRDRGLVLKELNCAKWAKDDFDYFIKACPNDPMARFIRLQLEEQQSNIETIH